MPIRANYPEEFIPLMLECYFTILSWPFNFFEIELLSRHQESKRGADAVLRNARWFKPFYMQFKVPLLYSPIGNSNLRQDRKNLSLQISPNFLAFWLREKRPSQQDYQHNVLYRLRQQLFRTRTGDAAYVCPLFIDKGDYRSTMRRAAFQCWPLCMYRYFRRKEKFRSVDLYEARQRNTIGPFIVQDPLLIRHVVIPPHAPVQHAKHAYSFTPSGLEICFHSPKALPEHGQLLTEWLEKISVGIFEPSEEYGFIPADLRKMERVLRTLVEVLPEGPIEFEVRRGSWEEWLAWGAFLERKYKIYQFAFIVT